MRHLAGMSLVPLKENYEAQSEGYKLSEVQYCTAIDLALSLQQIQESLKCLAVTQMVAAMEIKVLIG